MAERPTQPGRTSNTPPTARAEHAMSINDVWKEFNKRGHRVEALQAIDFAVERNEFAAILGPSGCGKSTLLNMVAGFDTPTRGRVLVDGAPVSGPAPSRAVVFQEPALFPWYSVLDNITFGPKTRGLAPAEVRPKVDAPLEQLRPRGVQPP